MDSRLHESRLPSVAFLSALLLSSFFVPVRPQPIVRANDSDGERRLWAYVTIGHPTDPNDLYAYTLSYLSKIRDLDGDGLPEVAIGCADSVVAVDGQNGRLIWKIRSSSVIGAVRTISKGDADYIVVRSYEYGHLSLLSAVDGKALWNRTDVGWGYNTAVAPDLYGDGWGEIFVDSWSRDGSDIEVEIACISGATGSTIWTKSVSPVVSMILVESSLGDVALAITSGAFDVGYVLSLLNARTHEVIWSTDLPAFRDIPIITYSESTDLLFATMKTENGSILIALDPKDGEVVWEISFPRASQLLPLPDLDGDGSGDLLANVQEDGGPVVALSSSSGSTIWSSQLDAPLRPEPAALVGDVDKNGVSDIAVGTVYGRGIVYLLSGASGKALWNFSAYTIQSWSGDWSDINDILSPGDLNGDGSPDLVASSRDYCVYALSSLALPYTLDTEPPAISDVAFSPTSQRISISASIADALSGVRLAIIFYSTDGGATWGNITMTTPTSPSTTYEGAIPPQAPNVRIQFYVEALDAWDNVARSPTQEYIPTIPLWVYGVIGVVMVLLVVFIIGRRRRAYHKEMLLISLLSSV